MAQSLHAAELWLTSNFLTAQDMLGDKENNVNGVNAGLDAAFCFPSEFPYEFDLLEVSSALSSPVESVAGSTETESSGEEDFFAGLTRRLSQSTLQETRKLTVPISARDKAESQKTWGVGQSPQSTLSGIGSWSGCSAVSGDGSPNGPFQVPSPPTTPFSAENDAWDVLYDAAGQVSRLKKNGEVYKYDYQNRGLLGPPLAATPVTAAKNPSTALYSNHSLPQTLNQSSHVHHQHAWQEQVLKQEGASVWGRQAKANWLVQQQQIQNRGGNPGYQSVKCARPLSLPESTWPPLQVQHQNQQVQPNGFGSRAVSNGGSGVKKGCAGTGVFLPRQYGNPPEPRQYGNPPEARKKTSCASIQLPAKVVHALNLNICERNATSQARLSGAFATDYDALIARRNALLMQQRLNVRAEEALNHEIRLPQEWTY